MNDVNKHAYYFGEIQLEKEHEKKKEEESIRLDSCWIFILISRRREEAKEEEEEEKKVDLPSLEGKEDFLDLFLD